MRTSENGRGREEKLWNKGRNEAEVFARVARTRDPVWRTNVSRRPQSLQTRFLLEYSLSPISSSSALQAAMTAISSHLRSNFNIMPSTVYLTISSMSSCYGASMHS